MPAWINIPDIRKAFDFIWGPYVDTKNCAMSWCCKRLIPHAVVHLKKGPHIGSLNLMSSESHLKKGPVCRQFWISCQNVGDVFSSFDLPSVGLVANHLPSANNWRIWPSAPNSVESKTLLPGWNSRFTSSGSFHMPLLCEISQAQVPARNFPAHLKKGPMSEVLSLMSKRWIGVCKFRSQTLPRCELTHLTFR